MDEKTLKLLGVSALVSVVVGAYFLRQTDQKIAVATARPRKGRGNDDQGKFTGNFYQSGVVAPKAEGLPYFAPVIGPLTRY